MMPKTTTLRRTKAGDFRAANTVAAIRVFLSCGICGNAVRNSSATYSPNAIAESTANAFPLLRKACLAFGPKRSPSHLRNAGSNPQRTASKNSKGESKPVLAGVRS